MLIHHETAFDKILKYLKEVDSHGIKKLLNIVEHALKHNPYNQDKQKYKYLMWREQAGLNFPILYLSSICLNAYAIERGCDTILFATRDCSQWYKIFNKLYPDMKTHYFHCSRNMFETATENVNKYFNRYVKNLVGHNNIDKVIFVDIHGTGVRVLNYFTKHFNITPHCFLLSAGVKNYSEFPKISKLHKKKDKFINLVFDAKGSPIEMLNYDLVGTLQTYTKDGPIRDEPEYNIRNIKPYHKCINYMVDYMKPIKRHHKYKPLELHKLIKHMFKEIEESKPIISNHINHIGKHKKKEL